MPFPRNRFQQAGASVAELDALEADHQTLPENMQAWNEQHWATMDTDGLRAALDVRRSHGSDLLPVAEPSEDGELHAFDIKTGEPSPVEEIKPLTDRTVKELREIGANVGVEIPHGASKTEIVALIEEAFAKLDAEPDVED